MPRYAIGDLTLDLDVPERFECEYETDGSLVASDPKTGAMAEISTIYLELRKPKVPGQDAVESVKDDAKEKKRALHHDRPEFVSYFEPPNTWFAGFGRHQVIATLTKPKAFPEFADVLASIAPAHDPFPANDELAISDLRASHRPWFEQQRTWFRETISWSPDLPDAAAQLDEFWGGLVDEPAEDVDEAVLNGVALAFGDLLIPHGFEWCVSKDEWGTSLGVVALRGTANLLIVPSSFVGKRWERKEPPFVANALVDILNQVKKVRTDWTDD